MSLEPLIFPRVSGVRASTGTGTAPRRVVEIIETTGVAIIEADEDSPSATRRKPTSTSDAPVPFASTLRHLD